ncbi:hypothetical protein ACGFIF_01400 [Kribbella sp. NPDC049174]|uniref:hypothetical protein n=1 Tax=Kribbella sp. NPDC049174 TaxID=3364112 RepID=UPI0037191122
MVILVEDPVLWSAIAALSAVMGLVVVAVAAAIALSQLRELVRARHLDAMFRVYELIGSDAARRARRYVYAELTAAPADASAVDRENVETVCITYDRVGALIAANLVPEREVMASQSKVILRTWNSVEPYVNFREAEFGIPFAPHYRELAERASRYEKARPSSSRAALGKDLYRSKALGHDPDPDASPSPPSR